MGTPQQAAEPPGTGAAAEDAEPDAAEVARAVALRQLAAAPRSRAELARAMARKGVPAEATERVLDRFTEVGLLDDAAYAEMLVRSQRSSRRLARRALAAELRRRGVEREVAAAAVAQISDEDEEHAARELVAKRLRGMAGLEPAVQRRRLAGALARKGYSGVVATRVLQEAFEADAAGDLLED